MYVCVHAWVYVEWLDPEGFEDYRIDLRHVAHSRLSHGNKKGVKG